MPSFTRPRKSRPHFFYRSAAKGFPAWQFLEAGLEAGVNRARGRLSKLTERAFKDAANAPVKTHGKGRFAMKAGIDFIVQENVSDGLERIRIADMIHRAFEDSTGDAMAGALRVIARRSKGQTPEFDSGKRKKLRNIFTYEVESAPGGRVKGGSVMTVRGHGTGQDFSKMMALNEGLRTATAAEVRGLQVRMSRRSKT